LGFIRQPSCFKCNSTGKLTFKSSPEQRQNARVASAERKAAKVEDFAKEFPEIIDWFKRSGVGSQKPFDFAVSLQEALVKYGSLTDGQIGAEDVVLPSIRRLLKRTKLVKLSGRNAILRS
jgi:hypothetical protein